MSYLKGKALMGTLAGKTLCASTSASLSLSANTSDEKTKDDAIGDKDTVDSIGGTLTLEGYIEESTAQNTAKTITTAFLAKQPVAWTFAPLADISKAAEAVDSTGWTLASAAAEGVPVLSGMAVITSVDFSAPVDGVATFSVEAKIQGKITNA